MGIHVRAHTGIGGRNSNESSEVAGRLAQPWRNEEVIHDNSGIFLYWKCWQ